MFLAFAYAVAILVGIGMPFLVLFDIGGANTGWEGDYSILIPWTVVWAGIGFGGLFEEGYLYWPGRDRRERERLERRIAAYRMTS